MSCILNINRFIIPNDVIVSLTSVYKWMGKNEHFVSVVSNDLNRVVDQTIERDAYFLSQILQLDLTDARTRLIITKDSTPRTKEETTLYNIKEMLGMIQSKYPQMRYQSNDLLNLINYVFSHHNDIKYDYVQPEKKAVLLSQSMKSKRLLIDEMNKEMEMILDKRTFEPMVLFLNYFVDFYNVEPFTNKNQTASFLLLYLLILKVGLEAFRFISFFELIYEHWNEFEVELKNASFNWKEGYAQTLGFVRFMNRMFIKAYEKTDAIIRVYESDSNINKGDNIENTILNMVDVFTKEELRLIHPYVSESTINRALTKLRDDGLIKPLSKGRSAKWIRVYKGYSHD